MAARDFMPFTSPHGGHVNILSGPLNASESFREGELVGINSDGEVAEFPADGTLALVADMDIARIWGIAAVHGDTARTDGFARATGDLISFWPADDDTVFITRNITDASGAAVVPTGTMVGLAVTVEHNNSNWAIVPAVAPTRGTDLVAVIVGVLNASKNPIAATDTTTGVYALVKFLTK